MPKREVVYLQVMRKRAILIRERVQGLDRDAFDDDDDLQYAIAFLLQNIGETARLISPELRAKYPDIPWKNIVGMRNKVVHDYIDIDFEEVWSSATKDIPPLIAALDKAIQELTT